jgi:gliding motility-associated-like protein
MQSRTNNSLMNKKNNSVNPAIFFLIIIMHSNNVLSQCTGQVTHVSGTLMVGGVNTTVTSSGIVDVNTIYCPSTTPYFIGYNWSMDSSGYGSYTFNFTPAVCAATLNFSGVSNVSPHVEEVRIKVNGVQYAIPVTGTPNGCDPMAVLTMTGSVGGCIGCSVSGWNGTTITGPISSLTVLDTVILGQPAGSLFSLFICESAGNSINLGNDTTLCQGETLMVNATTENATYLWQDNSTNPTFLITESGTYWVNVTVNNCSTTDTLKVLYADCEIVLVMPNVFTPNGDEINDYFHPIQIKGIKQATLTICNRWGQKLFETDDLLTGWDGKYNSTSCSDGIYFWIIEYVTITNESHGATGSLTLIK